VPDRPFKSTSGTDAPHFRKAPEHPPPPATILAPGPHSPPPPESPTLAPITRPPQNAPSPIPSLTYPFTRSQVPESVPTCIKFPSPGRSPIFYSHPPPPPQPHPPCSYDRTPSCPRPPFLPREITSQSDPTRRFSFPPSPLRLSSQSCFPPLRNDFFPGDFLAAMMPFFCQTKKTILPAPDHVQGDPNMTQVKVWLNVFVASSMHAPAEGDVFRVRNRRFSCKLREIEIPQSNILRPSDSQEPAAPK